MGDRSGTLPGDGSGTGVGDLLRSASGTLAGAGVPSPRADAEALLAHALGPGGHAGNR